MQKTRKIMNAFDHEPLVTLERKRSEIRVTFGKIIDSDGHAHRNLVVREWRKTPNGLLPKRSAIVVASSELPLLSRAINKALSIANEGRREVKSSRKSVG